MIDWALDALRDRRRRLALPPPDVSFIPHALEASEPYVVVTLTGLITGLLAAAIAIATEWLADLREGVCTRRFYLNKRFCCWQNPLGMTCDDWLAWDGIGASSVPILGLWFSYVFYVVVGVTVAAASARIVLCYAPLAAGHGVPELKSILAGTQMPEVLSLRTMGTKCVALVLAVASGLSVGKEGPLVHVACCVGDTIASVAPGFRRNQSRRREVMSAAAAAGVTVAFGSPIGGVLFSLEELSYYFPYQTMWRSFICAMSAAVALQAVNPFRTGKLVMFQVNYLDRDWHNFELLFFAALGVFGGMFGAFFNQMMLMTMHMRLRAVSLCRRFPIHDVIVMTVLTGCVNYANIFTRVDTLELVSFLFRECREGDFQGLCARDAYTTTAGLLLLAGAAKIFLTLLATGLHLPVGYYMPVMAVGACVGRATGMLVQEWQAYAPNLAIFGACSKDQQCITPGVYALVGAAAAMGGVTRTAVSLVVIMFELTGALHLVLPIMIGVTVSKWVGDRMGGDVGLDHALMRQAGHPYLSQAPMVSDTDTIDDWMHACEVLIADDGCSIALLESTLQGSPRLEYVPIVSNSVDRHLRGYIVRSEVLVFLRRARAEFGASDATLVWLCVDATPPPDAHWADASACVMTPYIVSRKTPITSIHDVLSRLGVGVVWVLERGRLCGEIRREDVVERAMMIDG